MAKRKWTIEEEKYLNKYYLTQSVEKTAKALNRTVRSVQRKASLLGIEIYAGEYLTARMVAECFRVSQCVVHRWIHDLGLPAKKVKTTKSMRYVIDPEKFWKWAENHKEDICWAGYEICSILPEPRWVEIYKERYKTRRMNQHFTSNEVVQIKHMLHRGMTFKEIAAELGRTERSIEGKVRRIA